MDISIQWDPTRYRGDWGLTAGDLAVDGGLQSAVILSLFTDRIAAPDFVPPAGSPFDRHGWWGDSYEPSPIGSRLWQLNRAVKSDGTTLLNEARDYCQEALQWLVTAGVVASVSVTTWWAAPQAIGIGITIAKPQSPPQSFQYQWAWGASTGVGNSTFTGPASSIANLEDPDGGILVDPTGNTVTV